jgi:signal transduction histidine kinase
MFPSIRRQWTLIFVGLAIIPLLLAGLVISSASFRAQEQQALALQREVTRRLSAQITAMFGQIENQLWQLTHVGDFGELSAEAQAQLLSELISYEDGLESIALLDAHGHEQARVERMRFVAPFDLGDWSGTSEFLSPSASGEIYYGALTFDDSTGQPLMNLAFPLTDLRTGAVEGVLVGHLRIRKVWDLIRDSPVEDKQVIFVIDDQSRVIAHGTPSVVLRGTSFRLPAAPGIGIGLDGENSVLAWETIQVGEQTLYVVAEQPVAEALALAYHTVTLTCGLLLAALAAASAAGILAVRQIVRPIETLAETAQKIAAGDLSQQVQVESAAEIVALADSFNTMTAQLGTTLEGLEALNTDLERRVAERTAELETANVRLTELDRLKTQLIQDMSHELRTPLSVLGTSLYLLERKPERQAEYLQKLKDQIAKLTQIANSALDVSRLDVDKQDVHFAPVSLNEVVGQVANELSPQAETSGLELVLKRDARLGDVYGERSGLAQVVTHLITNAIIYTRAGCVEVITTTDLSLRQVCLQVRDTGRGIAPEDIPHLFERFYRGQGVGSSTIAGSGLGLAVVKEIVDLHEGSIEVESQVGIGTTFRVWLPLANAHDDGSTSGRLARM